jgi:hypothetical protein
MLCCACAQVYEKDAVVVQEGKRHEAFHLIVSGKVKLTAHSEDGKEYDLHTLAKAKLFTSLSSPFPLPLSLTFFLKPHT